LGQIFDWWSIVTLALDVRALSKRYGSRRAVNEVSFSLNAGEIVGFLGPNGAGKTTTMRMICGLIRPSAGSVEVLGQRVPGSSLRQVGAMIEEPSFYPYLSGRDNLRYAAGMHGGIAASRIDEVLKLVGLQGRSRDAVRKYSQGMRQRLGLARALLPEPKVILLDEPTNGLDPEGVAELRDVIRDLGSRGLTVLVSSHILGEVQKTVDRVLIIDAGKILADGPISGLFESLDAANVTYRLETSEPVRALEVLRREQWVISAHEQLGSKPISLVIPSAAAYRVGPLLVQAGVPFTEFAREAAGQDLEDVYLKVVQEAHGKAVQVDLKSPANLGANPGADPGSNAGGGH
jgi:ABC-2 type transport system ATP-binding protein